MFCHWSDRLLQLLTVYELTSINHFLSIAIRQRWINDHCEASSTGTVCKTSLFDRQSPATPQNVKVQQRRTPFRQAAIENNQEAQVITPNIALC